MHRIRLLSLIFAFASLLFCGTASAQVKWISPPQKALVTSSTLNVEGFLSTPVKGEVFAQLHQPGSTARPLPFKLSLVEEQIFSVEITLAPGINDITIEGSVLSVYYHPDPSTEPPPQAAPYIAYTIHRTKCTDCHSMWKGALAMNEGLPELCLKCHEVGTTLATAVTKKNRHTRKITPFCIGCHDPHASKAKKLIKHEGDLCAPCHKEYKGRSGHEGVADQPCALCHDPHKSAVKKMLRAQPEAICENCHKDKKTPTPQFRFIHSPVIRDPCSACHLNHSGDQPKLLRAKEPDLCFKCHDDPGMVGHTESIGQCSDCHRPHAAGNRKRVFGVKGLCTECHEESTLDDMVHDEMNGLGCMGCHNPHQEVGRLDARELCGKCHFFGDEDFTYPHASLPMKTVDQCTRCHQSHGSRANRGLLLGPPHYPVKSGGCEVCHATVNGKVQLLYAGNQNCIRCHGDTVGSSSMNDKANIHAPISRDNCVACHDPHVRTQEKMLLAPFEKLCDSCHDMMMMRPGNVKHGIFKEHNCRRCHQPHMSNFTPLLNTPQPDLCLECHKEVLPEDYKEDEMIHGALREGLCSGCHSPHTSVEEGMLRETRDELCAKCHQEILIGDNGKLWPNLHGPVGSGSCTACHDLGHLHKLGEDDKFLRVKRPEKVCADCHDTKDSHIPKRDRVRMGRLEGGCIGCHNPHGASNSLMLLQTY